MRVPQFDDGEVKIMVFMHLDDIFAHAQRRERGSALSVEKNSK